MRRGSINSHAPVVAALLLHWLFISCGHGPADGRSTLDKRIARLENPKSWEALQAEQDYFVDSLEAGVLSDAAYRKKYLTAWIASFPSTDSIHAPCEKLFGRVAIETPSLLKPLVADICRALKTRGAEQAAQTVAALPYGIDARQYPQIASRLLTSALLPGTTAPRIAGLAPARENPRYTLLLFHESACRSCGNIVRDLKNHFAKLQLAGVRVVTISTDTNPQTWPEYAAGLPWPDKLCDYRGFDGPDPVAYGVAATPTLYLIDRAGKVVDQYGSIEQILTQFIPVLPI